MQDPSQLAEAYRLICVLEVHDTTGYGEDSAAGTLDQAADYWIDQAAAGQEILVTRRGQPLVRMCPATSPIPTAAV